MTDDDLPISSLDMVRILARHMSARADANEQALLLFIYERTYLWFKTEDYISEEQFLHGVEYEDGFVRRGLGFSRATLYRVLKSLVGKGMLLKSPSEKRGFVGYSLNHEFRAEEIKSLPGDTYVSPMRLDQSHQRDLTNRDQDKRVSNKSAPVRTHASGDLPDNVTGNEDMAATPAKEALQALLQKTTEDHKANRAKRAKTLKASGYMAAWQDAFAAHFPDDRWFTWTIKDQAAFKRALEKIPADERLLFVDFIVRMWEVVIRERFSWMRSKPELPVVGFATKQIAIFYQAYQHELDPNRKVKSAIKRTEETPVKRVRLKVHTASDKAKDVELAKLREENDNLKKQVKDKTIQRVQVRRRETRKLIAGRKPLAEFGAWPDNG